MTTNEYMANIPEKRRAYLSNLRQMIKSEFPNIYEDMGYQMPTFTHQGEILCSIANQKEYMALYITPFDLLKKFKTELNSFKHEASCIQFEHLDKKDIELFRRILNYCVDNISDSRFNSRMNSKK